tara:strand:+ start:487 stop:1320 length:834 start_codon:yes stop_codon:yes gene_type:complete
MDKIQPVIIIGAPRSGTNILRDTLVEFNDVCTWPFDETNFLWKKGHKINENDELSIDQLSKDKILYVKKEFKKISRKNKSNTVIEKTCANSLRVPYIDKILPNAKFIFIYRNPIDAIVSIESKWKKGLNFKMVVKKIPWFNIIYLLKFITYKLFFKLFYIRNQYSRWGPMIKDIDEIIKKNNSYIIATLQWKKCFQVAKKDLEALNKNRVFNLRYEDFVNNPSEWLIKILNFMNISYEDKLIITATANINKKSIGKGKKNLTDEQLAEINKILSLCL